MNEVPDALVRLIAHDLRNPLQAIVAAFSYAQRTIPEADEQLAKMLGIGLSAAHVISELTLAAFDLSEILAGRLKPRREVFDLCRTVREAVSSAVPLIGGRTLKATFADEVVMICADPELVRKIFRSLWSVAEKFTPARESVLIHIEREAGLALIAVRDDVSEWRERLLPSRQLATDRQAGREYGVALEFCKAAVVAQGGNVGIRDLENGRCTLWFTLPVAA